MFRKIFLIVLFMFVNISSNVFAESKIAFIDLNYVFNNSSAGKLINKNIEIVKIIIFLLIIKKLFLN